MNHAALSPDSQLRILFFLTLLPACWLMKWIAFRDWRGVRDFGFVVSPWPTPAAFEKQSLPLREGPRLLRRHLVALAACVGAYVLYRAFVMNSPIPQTLLSYPGAFILWLVTETLGSLAPFAAAPSGRLLPLPHGAPPPLARGPADFWGRRWNVWMSGWFHQVIFQPRRRQPVVALFLVFALSGLLHEWVINLPLYLVTGRNCFGSMMAYFLLQAVGLRIERRVHHRRLQIFLAWLFVLGPAPLVVNEGLLRILGLWPE